MALKIPSIKGGIESVNQFELADLPVGKTLLLLPAIGIMEGLNSAVGATIEGLITKEGEETPEMSIGPVNLLPLATGIGIAYGLTKVKQIKGAVGTTATQALALGSLLVGANRGLHVQAYSRYLVARAAKVLGAEKPWEIADISERDWNTIVEGDFSWYSGPITDAEKATYAKEARKRAGLEGAPIGQAVPAPVPVSMRAGIAAAPIASPAFETAPSLAGAPAAGAIDDINRVVGRMNLPQAL